MFKIRPFNSDDVEPLAELMSDLGYPTTADQMKQRMKYIEAEPNYYTFVATMNGIVVGMIGIRQVFYYEEDGCATQISALVTKKEFEGQGVGTALIRFSEKWAVDHHSNGLYLTSGMKPERIRAHEFYKKQGFEITGYRFVKRLETSLC
jgi:GNAT superfamily N-acetyltransferase